MFVVLSSYVSSLFSSSSPSVSSASSSYCYLSRVSSSPASVYSPAVYDSCSCYVCVFFAVLLIRVRVLLRVRIVIMIMCM